MNLEGIEGKFDIVLADPPWSYNDKSKSHGGGAESHYPCMGVEDICNLPVASLAAENSVLLCWVTMPLLAEGLAVIKAWGYTYKTNAFTWIKTYPGGGFRLFMGMGRYTRANAELCLLATRGKGLPRQNAGIHQVHLHPVLDHSAKPHLFRELIDKLFGTQTRKIELFSRKRVPGWEVWGNQVDRDDKQGALFQ